MPEDTRNFVERSESVSENLNGSPLTLDGMVETLAMRDLKTRALELDYVENELNSDEPLSLKQAVKHLEASRRLRTMKHVHHALRKAGR